MANDNYNWTPKEISDFKEQIEAFKSYQFKEINDANFFEAYKIMYLLCDRIPLTTTNLDMPYILRGRTTPKNVFYTHEHEISYITDKKVHIGLGRFNRPNESRFYAAVPDEVEDQHFGLVASMECYRQFFEEDNTESFKHITLGKWYKKTNLPVINLCYDIKCMEANPKLGRAVKKHEADIYRDYPEPTARLIIDFWQYLSSIAGKKRETDNDHFITTAFFCAITKYRETVLEQPTFGILFPSTVTDNHGLNTILHPKAIDFYYELKSVFMIKMEKDYSCNPVRVTGEQCSELAMVTNKQFTIIKRDNY